VNDRIGLALGAQRERRCFLVAALSFLAVSGVGPSMGLAPPLGKSSRSDRLVRGNASPCSFQRGLHGNGDALVICGVASGYT
jgi:hypothetical protein